jgi:archaellum component FlaC
MAKKKITIEDLAMMVQHGFKETARQADVDARFDAVDKRFDAVDERLDRIEKLILADHKRRIERLEGEMKDLKDMLAVK